MGVGGVGEEHSTCANGLAGRTPVWSQLAAYPRCASGCRQQEDVRRRWGAASRGARTLGPRGAVARGAQGVLWGAQQSGLPLQACRHNSPGSGGFVYAGAPNRFVCDVPALRGLSVHRALAVSPAARPWPQVAGTQVVPLEVEVLGDPRRLRVVVQEGKKHEVRAGWEGAKARFEGKPTAGSTTGQGVGRAAQRPAKQRPVATLALLLRLAPCSLLCIYTLSPASGWHVPSLLAGWLPPWPAAPGLQVRELVKAAGLDLTSLKRVRIGGFRLPADLGLGGYRWAGG